VTVRRPGNDAPFAADETSTGETLALTLRFDACSTERVPAPGTEHASGDGSEYGRVVETFVVEAAPVETDADGDPVVPKPVPEVTLPGPDESPDEAGRRLAAETFDRSPSTVPLVLATVTKTDEEVWTVGDARRPLVYPNDLVYATVAAHATDRSNPHGVAVGQVEGAVASVGGVDPDGDGDVEVRSEGGAIDVTATADALVLDSDALRSVAVEGEGDIAGDADGQVTLYSPDSSVAISTDAPGNRVGFRAAALRSVAVEGDGAGTVDGDADGRVTFHSPDGSVDISADEDGDRVAFRADVDVDVDLEGALRELQGLTDHGGTIEFTSSNGSIAVEQFEDSEDTLDVRVTERFVEEFRERLLEELRDGDEGPQIPIDRLREEVRTEVEASFADRFDELRRTNETLSDQVSRLSAAETDPTRTPVTTLEGIDLSSANDLREIGVVTVSDLAEADAQELRTISGVGEVTATDWQRVARERIGR
jgi:predicted flap endonuclease-1-like 5' DNA nuclease